jgi:hypothetical protein
LWRCAGGGGVGGSGELAVVGLPVVAIAVSEERVSRATRLEADGALVAHGGDGIMTAGWSWLAGGCDSGERRVRLSCDTTGGRWRTGSSRPRGSFPRVCKH